MPEDVWSEQDATPSAVEEAFRRLLFERHAADAAYAPARVLNLVVVVDREWRGEIANRLERVGRYHASRTILCTVEPGRGPGALGRGAGRSGGPGAGGAAAAVRLRPGPGRAARRPLARARVRNVGSARGAGRAAADRRCQRPAPGRVAVVRRPVLRVA